MIVCDFDLIFFSCSRPLPAIAARQMTKNVRKTKHFATLTESNLRSPCDAALLRRVASRRALGSSRGGGVWESIGIVGARLCARLYPRYFVPATQERAAVEAAGIAARGAARALRAARRAACAAAVGRALRLPVQHVRAYTEVTTRDARSLVPGGAVLVRVSSVKAFDTLCRLRQVPPSPRAQTPP